MDHLSHSNANPSQAHMALAYSPVEGPPVLAPSLRGANPSSTSGAASTVKKTFRSRFIRQVTLWHWVSSAICLGGMLLFTVTGITLNHASAIQAKPLVQRQQLTLSAELRALIFPGDKYPNGQQPLPSSLHLWLVKALGVQVANPAEWSQEEIYLSLPRPGGDAWVTIDRVSGGVVYETSDRGWIAYANDLHKGRHTSQGWNLYIDLLAFACLVFTVTGILLLQTHAAKRPATWPLIAFSLISPFVMLLLFSHT